MNKKTGKSGQSRDRHKERLTRPEYDRFRAWLAEALEKAEISQREFSRLMDMPSSFTNKILMGTRPVEITEMIDIAKRLGIDPLDVFKAIL